MLEAERHLTALNAVDVPLPDRKALDALLYGIENLRKRDVVDDQEDKEYT